LFWVAESAFFAEINVVSYYSKMLPRRASGTIAGKAQVKCAHYLLRANHAIHADYKKRRACVAWNNVVIGQRLV
jgi:hypothetical protein